MEDKSHSRQAFLIVLLAFVVLGFFVLRPYLMYVIAAILLLVAFKPVSIWLHERINNRILVSIIMLLLILIIIVLPGAFLIKNLFQETSRIYSSIVVPESFASINQKISALLGTNVDVSALLSNVVKGMNDYLLSKSFKAVTAVTDIAVGLFIMFFILFYGFKSIHGPWFRLGKLIPLDDRRKRRIFSEIETVTNAVVFGQGVAALAQGAVGLLGFLIFGLPNPFFWGLAMAVFSFIPFLGTPLVWLPAGILELLNGNTTIGILFLLYNLIFTTNVDNLIKPYLISSRSRLHPIIVVLGVFGGISAFGIIGMILGPIILALLIILLEEYTGLQNVPVVVGMSDIKTWMKQFKKKQ
ncbi:MAG: AI-2E family transporter [archaeon]